MPFSNMKKTAETIKVKLNMFHFVQTAPLRTLSWRIKQQHICLNFCLCKVFAPDNSLNFRWEGDITIAALNPGRNFSLPVFLETGEMNYLCCVRKFSYYKHRAVLLLRVLADYIGFRDPIPSLCTLHSINCFTNAPRNLCQWPKIMHWLWKHKVEGLRFIFMSQTKRRYRRL